MRTIFEYLFMKARMVRRWMMFAGWNIVTHARKKSLLDRTSEVVVCASAVYLNRMQLAELGNQTSVPTHRPPFQLKKHHLHVQDMDTFNAMVHFITRVFQL